MPGRQLRSGASSGAPGLRDIRNRLVAAYRMIQIKIENRAAIIHAHASVVAFQTLRGSGEEKDIHTHRLHQYPVVKRAGSLVLSIAASWCSKTKRPSRWGGSGCCGRPFDQFRPSKLLSVTPRHFRSKRAPLVAVDLNVHDHRAGLLDLADAPQFHLIAEPGGNFSARGICAQIAGRDAWQHKENCSRTQQNAEHQHWGSDRERSRHPARSNHVLARCDSWRSNGRWPCRRCGASPSG